MPLNKEGIRQLKFDLRANAAHYSQETFGTALGDTCGTECCMAGMCRRREIGEAEFAAEVAAATFRSFFFTFQAFAAVCLASAAKQLGVVLLSHHMTGRLTPPIFSTADAWPLDLAARYKEAVACGDRQAAAEVACDALDRMDEYGRIAHIADLTPQQNAATVIEQEAPVCR